VARAWSTYQRVEQADAWDAHRELTDARGSPTANAWWNMTYKGELGQIAQSLVALTSHQRESSVAIGSDDETLSARAIAGWTN
jgi:hypothetical protein